MTRSGMSVGNWLIVRMLRSANGLGNTVNNDLSGWIRVLPAGPIFGLSAFSVCSQRRLYRQRLRPKASLFSLILMPEKQATVLMEGMAATWMPSRGTQLNTHFG
jgi:hypothetical protein